MNAFQSAENDQRLDSNSLEDDIILDMEENPESENVPPNSSENNQNQANTQNQSANTQTNQTTNQADTNSNIAEWIRKEFYKATEGTTPEEKIQYASILLGDRSMLPECVTYLTMSDTSEKVCLMYGLTMVPSPYQTGNEQQIIGFFDKRRAEVPSTQWISPQHAMDAIEVCIPPFQELVEAKRLDSNIKFIPRNEEWKKVFCPPIAPFPTQWAEQIKDQSISPIDLAFKLESSITAWTDTEKEKIQPLIDWIHAACVRANHHDQEQGSIMKLPWRSFYFITDESFQWASRRLDNILGPWNHPRNVQLPAPNNQLTSVLAQLSAAVVQQSQILSAWRGTGSDASMPRIIGATPTPPGHLSEYEVAKLLPFCGLTIMEQHKIPKFWNRFLSCRDKEAKLNFLQMRYSYEKTKDIDINIQITEQLVKDLSKLNFGRGPDVSIDKCNEGISPFSCIPLEEKEAKKRALEEEARRNATTTTVADYKNKKKYTPVIHLKNEALRMVLKNYVYLGLDIFGDLSPYFKLINEIEIEVKRNIAQGTVFEEEQVLGLIFSILKEARFHFATECTMEDMRDQNGLRPQLRYLPAIVQQLQSGLSTARHDIPQDWRKQYPTRQYLLLTGQLTPFEAPSQDRNGGPSSGNTPRRLQVNQQIQAALRPIINAHGRRLNLGSLLRYANTNITQLLGERYQNHCVKAILTGQCHQNCTKVHEDPTPQELINRILQHIRPGIQQYVERGPIAPAPRR